MTIQRKLLAFAHIEKAAGQTFISVLENNYTYRHCRVKPLKTSHKGVFTADDLRTVLRINPFVTCISGHSVKPFSDLEIIAPNVRYLTLLRDPVMRYISHYQYQVEIMGRNFSFDDFLNNDFATNLQTTKIAGSPDVNEAKRILTDKFLLVGLAEQFDEFLLLLQKKLLPETFDVRYERRNIAKTNRIKATIMNNITRYQERIIQNNLLDIDLYEYVKQHLFKQAKATYLASEGLRIQDALPESAKLTSLSNKCIGRLYRGLYYAPIIKLIRHLNGLPINGSY